ncbi:MAG: hypothetical protein ACJATI_002412 [Halioglobus sp.]|jgi:hypothetical protein
MMGVATLGILDAARFSGLSLLPSFLQDYIEQTITQQ